MGHFILGTLNAFLYCVLFMVVLVAGGILYALFKYFCSDDEGETTNGHVNNHIQNGNDYVDGGFSSPSAPQGTTYEPYDPAPRYEHIPLNPMFNKSSPRVSPRASPIPYPPPTASNAPYPVAGSSSGLPYPTSDATPMPMPMPSMPMPGAPYPPTAPVSPSSIEPPSYYDAMKQPPYNLDYKGN